MLSTSNDNNYYRTISYLEVHIIETGNSGAFYLSDTFQCAMRSRSFVVSTCVVCRMKSCFRYTDALVI